jgi:hydrogenase expression/formation protein HypE
MMHDLIDYIFIERFASEALRRKSDSAIIKVGTKRIAFTTDSYVVDPIFFPGGDIGSLAVYGTVNDLAVCGARPLHISLGLVIEEGLDMAVLEKITDSIARAAKRSNVDIVTGDTKVVGKGSCDRIFINTSGIGEVYYTGLDPDRIAAGDSVIVSGPVGEHAVSVLSKREGLSFASAVKSDSAPLNGLIGKILSTSGKVRFMRDPTRGGLAATLNEIAEGRSFGITLNEKDVPVSNGVRSACEMLGLDPLYLACEGRAIVVVSKEEERKVLNAMRRDPLGRLGRVIGAITKEYKGKVVLNTVSGGKRIIDMPAGEQLPRIC